MTIITLPYQFRITAVNKFTAQIFDHAGNLRGTKFTLDFGKLNFIDGSGYTVLSNSIAFLQYNGAEVILRNFKNLQSPAIQYLDDCGFFRRYLKYQLRQAARVRGTTLPCEPIAHERGFSWIENRLGPWLSYALDVPPPQLASVRTCVKEVWNNVADHSSVATGFAHAQHYPNMHELKITLSDFGQGIPATIKRAFGDMPDHEAISLATQEGVTSKSRKNNMGAGLAYLTDTIIAKRGRVRLHSLSGNVTCSCDHRGVRQLTKRRGAGFYPGTLVEIELDTRLFIGDDDERGDFEWM